jgi:hypothetical protein
MYVYRDKAQHIIKFGVRCRQVVRLMLRSFSLVERDPQVPGRVGPRAVPDVVVEKKIFRPLPRVEPYFVF